MIKTIPIFDGEIFAEWTRYFNYILKISRPLLNRIIWIGKSRTNAQRE